MSGPKMCINPKKMLPDANLSRPGGCSALAISLDPQALLYAAFTGNRATRREAARNLRKQAEKWAKTLDGKQAMADKEHKQ